MGDEGVGVRVAQYLFSQKLPEGVTCLDGGTGGFHLLEHLQEADTVFLIDAINDGQHPGTITVLTPRYSKDYPATLTAHDIGLKDLIDSLYLLGKVPNIRLFAVSIKLQSEPVMELSAEMDKAVPRIADQILKETLQRI